jgi:hypothetical protein
VKRRRTGAPGRYLPVGRWPLLFLLVLTAIAAGSCGSTAPSSDSTSPTSEVAASEPAPSLDATPDDVSTAPTGPSNEPSVSPSTGSSASASDAVGGASACSGSDANRDFFASMAAAVEWTVYCPVLPHGWFVEDGQYRLAEGGWMEISFDGPGTARIVLRQGMFCSEGGGCVPSGTAAGEAAFADRTAQVTNSDDGSWSFVVDRGGRPSWLLLVEGTTEPEARSFAAALVPILD